MNKKIYKEIANWAEKDLVNLPSEEDDFYEYKSSRITFKALKKKISIAASAFWNSGGGVLIIGVDNNGKIDGGISQSINNQKLRDWLDQVFLTVNPIGQYKINVIQNEGINSLIDKDKVVIIILFEESYDVHMAYNYKYYIRTGAHSNPANHFLVEALRSRRGLMKPLLKGVLKLSENKPNVVQLVILALNNSVALNVKLSFNPLPISFEEYFKEKFPLTIPAIDKDNPFTMDLYVFTITKKTFGENPVELILKYNDIAGNKFKEKQIIDPSLNLGPMLIGPEILEKIQNSIEKIENSLRIIANKKNN